MPKVIDTHHLKLFHNTWFIRVQIPTDVRSFFGNQYEIVQTTKLKSSQVEDAKLLRDQFLASFKLRVRRMRNGEDHTHINDLEFTPEYWSKLQREDQVLPEDSEERRGLEEMQMNFHLGAVEEAINLHLEGGMSKISGGTNPNKLDAVREIDEVAYQKVIKHLSIVKGETFGSLIDQYMATRAVTRTTLKYQADMRKQLVQFSDKYSVIESINKAVVNDWKEEMERDFDGSSTVSKRLGLLRGYWDYLLLTGLVDERKPNPFAGHKITKKIAHKREMFTLDEAKLLVRGNEDAIPNELLADFIKLGFLTGCRVIELTSIKESNIILHENITVIDITEGMTKGSAKAGAVASGIRMIPLTNKMEEIINRLISNWQQRKCHPDNAGKGYLFDTGMNQYGDMTRAMSGRFSKYKEKLGFPKKTKVAHGFRHTANSYLMKEGVSAVNRQSLFGWVEDSSTSMANTVYANQEFAYPMSARKEHLEILGEEFWFI